MHSPVVRVGELEREREGELWLLGCRLLILYWQLLTRKWNIHYLGWGLLGSRVLHFFLPHLLRGLLSWHPPSWAHLAWSGFLRLCLGALPGQVSAFPESWPWLPLCWLPGILLELNQLPTLSIWDTGERFVIMELQLPGNLW